MVKLLCEALPSLTESPRFTHEEILNWPAKVWEDKCRKFKANDGPWSSGFVDSLPFQTYSNDKICKLVAGIMFPYALVCDCILPGFHEIVWENVHNKWVDGRLNVKLLEGEEARKRKNYEATSMDGKMKIRRRRSQRWRRRR